MAVGSGFWVENEGEVVATMHRIRVGMEFMTPQNTSVYLLGGLMNVCDCVCGIEIMIYESIINQKGTDKVVTQSYI